jgi:hypothetical protein
MFFFSVYGNDRAWGAFPNNELIFDAAPGGSGNGRLQLKGHRFAAKSHSLRLELTQTKRVPNIDVGLVLKR